MLKRGVLSAALFCAGFVLAQGAHAQTFDVQVGYADNIRSSPFFPLPWQGDPGVAAFLGSGPSFDAGAIRIINTGATTLTLDAFNVDSFGDGSNFNIWGGLLPQSFAPGTSLILTQTGEYNFDTSDDEGSNPNALPVVHLNIDGTSQSFTDTAQVLSTEGTDHLGGNNLNESHQWRDIGTYGGQAAVPEPGAFAFLSGLGLTGAAFLRRHRRTR
jgi:hypothetical protein